MRYFDKTFFKFLFGFAVVILVSLSLVFAVGIYETGHPESAGQYQLLNQ